MSARVLSFFRPAPATSGDWSQQELAEFYRVEAASLQAGLRLSLERGLSDEGDPWLVFCREDGEVFLHFARVDGSYVIVSDMVGEPLIGPDFRALLAELVARNPSVLPIHRDAPGGTGARSGAQVLMHPAALLAAIVATTCLFSTMNEAVASELDSGPLPGARPTADMESHLGFASVPLHHDHDVAEADSARARAGEQRELAVSTSVVMACIASFLDQSSPRTDLTVQNKLASTEALSQRAQASTETVRSPATESKRGDQGNDSGQWLEHQEARDTIPTHATTSVWPQLTPREAGAILLSTPGASVVTLGSDGSQLLARGGVFDGAASLQFVLLPSAGTARLVIQHAADGPSVPSKSGSASSASTGAGSDSSAGLDSSAPATAANETGHQIEPSRVTSPADKALVSSSLAASSNALGGSGNSGATSATASGAEASKKLILAGSSDGGSSANVAQVKSSSTVVSNDSPATTGTLLSSDTTGSKSVLSPLQDLTSLTAKTVSLFLHTLIGDTTKVGALDGSDGPLGSQDIILVTGAATSTVQSTSASNKVSSGQSTSGGASIFKIDPGSSHALVISASNDHSTLDPAPSPSSIPVGSTAHASQADSAHTASASDASTLITKASAIVSQAVNASSGQATQIGGVDAAHVTSSSSTDTALVATQGSAITAQGMIAAASGPTAAGTSTNAAAAGGTDPASSTITTEAEHTAALHTVTALVSSTNTITKAVSISLATGSIPLDAAQLRIIDTFIASTPNVKIVATGATLEIYDPSALDDPSIHAMSWDLGGGSSVKVIGISDAHLLG
ncbi:hypothetical protein [Methylobacterium soli]|uniref:Uncharacterized protein n=1 Tax=Methylobacterium soli TaxID=553447 RepID=A0A6L3SZS4_9HYPH|nr:hypothetical protein [Methylobacterium soli]KAB1079665.1 hypothetical protein F6X53_10320 [Methylobacterium soli]GJE43740.1 hypothetical protein AEGHOMDF_2919 [Methylobacterium soli]